MDSLGDLLPFLAAAVYLALKFRRRPERSRPAPSRPQPARAASPSTAGPTPFEQLLARLEQEATDQPTVVPEGRREFERSESLPAPEPQPDVRRPDNEMFAENRAAFARGQERAAEATAFRSLETTRPDTSRSFFDARGFDTEARGFEHDRHGFGDENPTSEDAFSRARDADRRPTVSNRMAYDPHGLSSTPAPAPTSRLGSPAAIREAFVLSTLLGRRPPLRRPAPVQPPADGA